MVSSEEEVLVVYIELVFRFGDRYEVEVSSECHKFSLEKNFRNVYSLLSICMAIPEPAHSPILYTDTIFTLNACMGKHELQPKHCHSQEYKAGHRNQLGVIISATSLSSWPCSHRSDHG